MRAITWSAAHGFSRGCPTLHQDRAPTCTRGNLLRQLARSHINRLTRSHTDRLTRSHTNHLTRSHTRQAARERLLRAEIRAAQDEQGMAPGRHVTSP